MKRMPSTLIALANVPRYCTASSFVEDSKLFQGGSKPPSLSTVRYWMKTGKIRTAKLAGKTYIDLHNTLRDMGAAY